MNIFTDSWLGREKLWKVFWIYNVLIGYILEKLTDSLITNGAIGISIALIIVLFLPWAIWITVSLWRCAYNTEFEILGHLVRALTVLGIIFTIGFLVITILS